MPVYWITVPGIEEEVKQAFPDIIHHWFFEANRGIYHKDFHNIQFSLDKKIINDFIEYEKTSMDMLQRYDPYKSFTYEERKRLYYNQLKYWLYVIKNMRIDVLFLTESPHSISQYVCYAVCKYYKVEIIMLGSTSIPGMIFLKKNIEDTPMYFIKKNKYSLSYQIIFDNIERYIRALGGSYKKAEPLYMKEQKIKSKLKIKTIDRYHRIKRRIKRKDEIGRDYYFKLPKRLIEQSFMSFWDLLKIKIHARKTIKSLTKKYKNLSRTPDLKEKYIYFPLHYQPERTSCPEGDIYSDQTIVINMISNNLPDNWFLYVKEHPSQFMLTNGYMGRDSYFYDDIVKLPNVRLIDQKFTTFELIDNAKAVATLTGTVALEAIIRNIPALVFGYAWYRDSPGIFYTLTNEECKNAILKIEKGFRVKSEHVKAYLLSLHQKLTIGFLNPSNQTFMYISKEEHEENLYQAITSIVDDRKAF